MGRVKIKRREYLPCFEEKINPLRGYFFATERLASSAILQIMPSGSAASPAIATFGAGCFWGTEETFRVLDGVLATAVGYCGGITESPTYEAVCTDLTGHAEVVQVTYDPAKISYEKLLDVFWTNHNPTTMNQQGPDFGSQYRSVIFAHSSEQKKIAEASKKALEESGTWQRPIVTQIVDGQQFYPAEDYHQQYLKKRGLGSCHI